MYQTERELLDARNLTSYDRVAQRALRLRYRLRALVPFAMHDESALLLIANTAVHVNAMIVACHHEREYEFVHQQLFHQSVGKTQPDAIDRLPEINGALPLSDYEQMIADLEHYPEKIREARNLPRALISGINGVKILHGQAALDACAEMRQNAANAA